jgi:hypothetical protein
MIFKETITQRQKIDYIVLLRAAAIILVVFAHATRSVHSPNPHMYSPLITPCWEIAIKDYIFISRATAVLDFRVCVLFFSRGKYKKRHGQQPTLKQSQEIDFANVFRVILNPSSLYILFWPYQRIHSFANQIIFIGFRQ